MGFRGLGFGDLGLEGLELGFRIIDTGPEIGILVKGT